MAHHYASTPSRPILPAILLLLLGLSARAQTPQIVSFRPVWRGTRQWISQNWWANPLYDWSLSAGSVTAAVATDRTLALLPYDIAPALSHNPSPNAAQGPVADAFAMNVTISISREVTALPREQVPRMAGAGFSIARRAYMHDYRAAAVYAVKDLRALVLASGHLQLGTAVSKGNVSISLSPAAAPVRLHLSVRRIAGALAKLSLVATQGDRRVVLRHTLPFADVAGPVALAVSGPPKNPGSPAAFAFRFVDFALRGASVRQQRDRTYGPILWSQYTLSGGVLRLQAMLAPIASATPVELWVRGEDDSWAMVATARATSPAMAAVFEKQWDATADRMYEVRVQWSGRKHTWRGTIRREPLNLAEPFKIGMFSCDKGYTFPDTPLVTQVTQQNPDMLFFAGDQIYEFVTAGFSVARDAPVPIAVLDFLRKYYLFGWLWRTLLRDRPAVILPDDHDMFQGNLWGGGGVELPKGAEGEEVDTSRGGYIMPGEWINAVEKCHVGHLPPPAVDVTLPNGCKPYFTALTYGNVSFAVLEDRKFKTGPLQLPKAHYESGGDGDLLGPLQEQFLTDWSRDWKSATMKIAFSQTIFARAATHLGQTLELADFIQDSGAWPKRARDRAVRTMGDANVLSLHGDQHLGLLLRNGVAEHDDAGFAFMVPGTANGFPRAWWPGLVGNQRPPASGNSANFTGWLHDPAGNPVNVLAVANPTPDSGYAEVDAADPREAARLKGSGYGLVELDREGKTARVNLFRVGRTNEQFEGFPKTIPVGGKPGAATEKGPMQF